MPRDAPMTPLPADGKKRFGVFLRLAGTVIALAALLLVVDIEQAWQAARTANVAMLLLAIACYLAGVCVGAARWRFVLAEFAIHVPFRRVLRANFIGIYAGTFLPGIVGGDLVRPFALQAGTAAGKSELYGTILFERVFGVFATLLLSGVGLLTVVTLDDMRVFVVAIAVVLAGAIAGLGALMLPPRKIPGFRALPERFRDRFERFSGVIRAAVTHPKLAPLTLAYSVLFQFTMIGVYALLALALGPLDQPSMLLLVPLAWLAAMAPISISGIGVREGVIVLIFVRYGMDENVAASISLLGLIPMLAAASIGGLLASRKANFSQ